MLKKLFKYEIFSWLKTVIPIEIVVLGTALFNRVIQLFEVDTVAYTIIFVSSIVLLCVAVLVSFVGVLVISVRRFYRNLFSYEGYLTMSLPVTASQQIWVKLLTTLLFDLIAGICAFLAFMIATSGEVFVECMKAADYLYKIAYEYLKGDLPLMIVEGVLLLILTAAKAILVFYLCISLGQTAKKNRVLASVGIFFGYYFLMQVLSTVFSVFISVVTMSGELEEYFAKVLLNPIPYIQLYLLFFCIWSGAFGGLYFFLNRHLITKKLNLE